MKMSHRQIKIIMTNNSLIGLVLKAVFKSETGVSKIVLQREVSGVNQVQKQTESRLCVSNSIGLKCAVFTIGFSSTRQLICYIRGSHKPHQTTKAILISEVVFRSVDQVSLVKMGFFTPTVRD